MRSEVEAHIEKARRFLEGALRDFSGGDYEGAVSRTYYTMFHCAKALLLTRGLYPKTHEGVLASFSRDFIKTGTLPREMGVHLMEAKRRREKVDYVPLSTVTRDEAEDLIERARAFLGHSRKHLHLTKH
ncbi:MAG: HEPN domain-containing protein [Candidatus Bathyarchaeia archaeon]